MCGIFGICIANNSAIQAESVQSLVNELFKLSEIRGKESSGIVVKNHVLERISVLRRSCPGSEFIKTREFKVFSREQFNDKCISAGISILGHTRIATNGMLTLDNQPIVKNGCFGVHNGILCNIEELWEEHTELERRQVIDTELLLGLIKERMDKQSGRNADQVLSSTFSEIEGTASFGAIFDNYNAMLVGSNCGSHYYYSDAEIFLFASEEYILAMALNVLYPNDTKRKAIRKMEPVSFGILNEKNLEFIRFDKGEEKGVTLTVHEKKYDWKDVSTDKPGKPFLNNQPEQYIRSILEYNIDAISKIKRCTKCILPETHPFIEYDQEGVCNYCRDFEKRKKRRPKGAEALEEHLAEIRKKDGVNCIVMLSGGRDSCYALHVVKKELGLNPVAYSYDWGMLTDLGRRNQARMCAQLGVEHIIVSADIKKKRDYVRMNVEAFLHKPHLGTIGLFMAGDKAYHHFAKELHDRMGLPLINGGCPLEWTYFKEGFSGIKPSFMKRTKWDKFAIVRFFMTQALKNPKYLNASIFDNLEAYRHYFLTSLDVTNLFHYLPWSEKVVNDTLINEYNWEVAPDTTTTWRIGDGTAAFYNYIYITVAGFTENDCFRSNQVLEGIITRDEALQLAASENKPRYESLKWYCDTIGVDLERAIKTINDVPKLYQL